MDVVDESNLQRQILHNIDRIGDRKVDSAKKTLTAAQPRRQRRHLRRAPRRRQRDGDPRGLRRRRRRHRQLPDPLPGQRRLGEARHPGRARLDLPLRGHGHGVRPAATARPTATWCPSRRRPSWPRRAPRPACSACCPASSGRSRRIEAIKLILDLGDPLIGRLLAYDCLEQSFRELQGAGRPDQRDHLGEPRPHRGRRARRALHAPPAAAAGVGSRGFTRLTGELVIPRLASTLLQRAHSARTPCPRAPCRSRSG